MEKKITVSILGCGWFGKALGVLLVEKGYQVMGSTTSTEKLESLNALGINSYLLNIDGMLPVTEDLEFWNCDALIIASNVKLQERPGYIDGIENLARIIGSKNIKKVIFVSSISVYGEPNDRVNEISTPNPATISAKRLLALEAAIKAIEGSQVSILRFGGLVGPARMPGSFLAGKQHIPNGLAPVNLIHLTDCIGITNSLLDAPDLPSYVNAVSPDHPTRFAFYTAAAKQQGLELPGFVLENHAWKIVDSVYQGYQYKIKDWGQWLEEVSAE